LFEVIVMDQKEKTLNLLDTSISQNTMQKEEKNKIMIACFVSLTIGNMMINNVVAVIPDMIDNQDWIGTLDKTPLNEGDVSLIVAIFSIAQIIFAPFNSSIKNRLGGKNTIIFGLIMMTVTTFFLAFLTSVKQPSQFMYIACTLRFL
jgi:MFS family permease